jgi:hypothetical protein
MASGKGPRIASGNPPPPFHRAALEGTLGGFALQSIDHGEQDVLDPAVFEFVHDPEPELRALVLLDPEAEDLLGAVRPHPERHVHGLVADHALVADLHPECIEEYQRVDRLERPVLPARHRLEHRVRHRADQVRRDVDAVELAQVPLDLAHAHAAGIQGDDLLRETIFSSKPGTRRWYLAISCGSKLASRSRGISS